MAKVDSLGIYFGDELTGLVFGLDFKVSKIKESRIERDFS